MDQLSFTAPPATGPDMRPPTSDSDPAAGTSGPVAGTVSSPLLADPAAPDGAGVPLPPAAPSPSAAVEQHYAPPGLPAAEPPHVPPGTKSKTPATRAKRGGSTSSSRMTTRSSERIMGGAPPPQPPPPPLEVSGWTGRHGDPPSPEDPESAGRSSSAHTQINYSDYIFTTFEEDLAEDHRLALALSDKDDRRQALARHAEDERRLAADRQDQEDRRQADQDERRLATARQDQEDRRQALARQDQEIRRVVSARQDQEDRRQALARQERDGTEHGRTRAIPDGPLLAAQRAAEALEKATQAGRDEGRREAEDRHRRQLREQEDLRARGLRDAEDLRLRATEALRRQAQRDEYLRFERILREKKRDREPNRPPQQSRHHYQPPESDLPRGTERDRRQQGGQEPYPAGEGDRTELRTSSRTDSLGRLHAHPADSVDGRGGGPPPDDGDLAALARRAAAEAAQAQFDAAEASARAVRAAQHAAECASAAHHRELEVGRPQPGGWTPGPEDQRYPRRSDAMAPGDFYPIRGDQLAADVQQDKDRTAAGPQGMRNPLGLVPLGAAAMGPPGQRDARDATGRLDLDAWLRGLGGLCAGVDSPGRPTGLVPRWELPCSLPGGAAMDGMG
mmetsp:Transcript_5187/g.7277  ORF Transcript_5187/g.7277 Transcript_5187/m.7277 type:complete len:621 (+) Transcript_5187:536-2398(+)